MRWLYPDEHDTEENAARKAVLSRVDRWWQSLAAQADAIAAYLHGAGEFDVPEFMAEQLEAVDPRLGWEFSATGPRRCRLVISVDGHLSLRPMVDAMLARAPALPNWEFLNAHPADTLAGALSAVEAETDHAVGRARVRAQVRSMNRVDLQFWLPDAGGHELARTQAVIAACRLLGEDALARWVGAIEAVNETGTGRWLPLDALQQAVFSEVAGVNARLPEVPLVSMVKDLRWSLWRLNPPQQGDYPGEQDLIMGSSALEEMSACAQLGAPFDSRRYSKVGETFCFLKFDGEGRKVAPRMDERKRVESALGAALVEGGLGCVVGAGTGRRYSYLDLALTDVQASLPLIRAHMRGAEVSRRSWLLFHDATLAEEWVGIYDDTPPPPR
ncbi:MAG: hypothetical protein HS108_09070 [Planctomycetes bacterium]|jgi:hypothetical protein|nr:hypothetical protein [Planctomycetota bacterium]MCL4731289.1 hypothetical protein [Planctomycetota bacterium]